MSNPSQGADERPREDLLPGHVVDGRLIEGGFHVRDTRDPIAIQFREREQARINVEGDGCVTALDEVESYLDGYENGIADLIAAGLTVPPGLTAEAMRRAAVAAKNAIGDGWAAWVPQTLDQWADALSTQENTQ